MKQLTLDWSTWRCGSNGPYKLGEGLTAMCNKEGFQCCLGQFSLQILPEITTDIMTGTMSPISLSYAIKKIIPQLSIIDRSGNFKEISYINTDFTDKAVVINDHDGTTPDEKIIELTALCKEHHFELVVINKPESV